MHETMFKPVILSKHAFEFTWSGSSYSTNSHTDRPYVHPADAVHDKSALSKSSSPVDIGIIVLGLLQCMGNVALGHSQSMTHQAGDQIPIAVVADDKVGVVAMSHSVQLSLDSLGGV